jgi:type VI secretion system Hcp family effector
MVCQKQQGADPMANHSYMTINGKEQGLISAGCSTLDSIGNTCQDGHRDEILVLSFQHHIANRGNVNAATHGPVVITKNIDKSSFIGGSPFQ